MKDNTCIVSSLRGKCSFVALAVSGLLTSQTPMSVVRVLGLAHQSSMCLLISVTELEPL